MSILNPEPLLRLRFNSATDDTTHTYDYADRQVSMTTYGTETATTTWTYSSDRGFLTRKQYHDGNGTDYTYTAAGRLATRTWARGVVTTYSYDSAGRLTLTDYSDTTPDVAITYDALNRSVTNSNGLATSTFAYDPSTLSLDTETIAYDWDTDGTPELTRVLDRSQDNLNRPTGWQLKDGTTTENEVTYTYSATDGRLTTVANGSDTFTYNYEADSANLLASVDGPAHTVTNTWETTRNALATKENKKLDTTTVSSFSYTVNEIGQRTDVDQTGTAFSATRSIAWGYDSKGQVVKADSTENAHDRAFQYDGIGNRLASETGSTTISNPAGTDTTEYTPNALNQYASITGSRSTGVPPVYDNDGNALTWDLTTDPLTPTANLETSNFIWDAENRLTAIEDSSGNTIATYTYDSQSRRIRRQVTGQADIAYIYDNWNPIAEYNFLTSHFSLLTSYTWGLDLSGSMQGAGGVGGLLATTDESGATSQAYYPTFDGNGNVSEYLDSTGAIIAHYEYDAFGNIVHYTEALAGQASSFRHRFSTKPQDGESGLLYYGYRYYDPITGRWPSRDPIAPNFLTGEMNEYAFVKNMSPNAVDFLGLTIVTGSVDKGGGNCLGGAVMNDGAVHLQPDHTKEKDQSFKEALEKQFGLKCKEVKSRDACKCECEEEKILITLYKDDDPKNKGKNPWNDPEFEWNFDGKGKPLSDIHSVRADKGCGNDYKQIPRAQPGIPGQGGFNKDINWDLFKDTPLLCCCYKKEK